MLRYPQLKGKTPQEQVAELTRFIYQLIDDCNAEIQILQDQITELKNKK